MGSFLYPPEHAHYNWHVGSKYADTFFMSLESAAESDWLDPETKDRAKTILDGYSPPNINAPHVQQWIGEVLRHLRHCYEGEASLGEERWSAGNLRIDHVAKQVENQDTHAGIHWIRKWYPDFVATEEHFFGGGE
jgi:hypothetical protein